ncbi:Peptidase family m48 family protein [Thalictrum thalictroides]|uniref:Peptidase family m48 family protein n=1 Tax=Thalictrum thalictroides TaxID=46969 RepID=A0A7J6WNA9_THATH|nr:Peptidase family m48 family protein [Thalictrum thalictroides]
MVSVEHHLSVGVASIFKEIIEVANKHVNGVGCNWELLVVDDPEEDAGCFPGGKIIVVSTEILIDLPFSRIKEREADYLGLLLMASAGYDPRIAPKVYEKFGLLDGDSSPESLSFFDKLFTYLLSTHPPSMEREKLLNQAQVMEEALTLYKQARIKKPTRSNQEEKEALTL